MKIFIRIYNFSNFLRFKRQFRKNTKAKTFVLPYFVAAVPEMSLRSLAFPVQGLEGESMSAAAAVPVMCPV